MNKEDLFKNWEHAYEEDTETEIVFRPSTYNFRPSRKGRSAINLRADNTFTQRGDLILENTNLAADDRYNYSEGIWKFDGDDEITLEILGSKTIKFRILSLTEDRLVLEKSFS